MNTTGQSVRALSAYLDAIFKDIQERLEHQRDAVRLCLDRCESSGEGVKGGSASLVEALRETVEVLEETKRSFKSKRLGELREKLERVLADVDKT